MTTGLRRDRRDITWWRFPQLLVSSTIFMYICTKLAEREATKCVLSLAVPWGGVVEGGVRIGGDEVWRLVFCRVGSIRSRQFHPGPIDLRYS